MKIYIYIISILFLFLFGCSKVRTADYPKFIEQIQRSIEIIDMDTKSHINDLNNIQIENLESFQDYFTEKLLLTAKTDSLINIIDSILKSKGYFNDEPLQINLKQKSEIEYADILKLKQGFSEIENAFLIVIKDIIGYPYLIEGIKRNLSTSNWSEIKALSARLVNKVELISVLLKLKLDLVMIEHDLISFIFSNIAASSFKFSNVEAYVIPNSEILPLGITYSAGIILASYDTTILLNYEIEGKNYEFPNGKGFYSERVIKKSGEVLKYGEFKISSPRTGKILSFPFTIQYFVLSN